MSIEPVRSYSSERSEESLLAFAKPRHVLFGSDWPYVPAPVVTYFTGQLDAYEGVDAAGHAGVDRTNAARLFQEEPAA